MREVIHPCASFFEISGKVLQSRQTINDVQNLIHSPTWGRSEP